VCGRISLSTPARVVAEHFDLAALPELAPRWNVAPGQPVAIVRVRRSSGERALELRRWGLVPPWAKDASVGARLVNARVESVAELPAFRRAFRERRCLVPADGFYEWQTRGKRFRQPYHVRPAARALLAIAGLYERWEGGEGERSSRPLSIYELNMWNRRMGSRFHGNDIFTGTISFVRPRSFTRFSLR